MSQGSSMNDKSRILWIVACEVIKWHNQDSDSCIDTLNRLWRKHPAVTNNKGEKIIAHDLPKLSETMIQVTAEDWSLAQLMSLKHERHHERDNPITTIPQIIVLKWFGKDFLIDGCTRINYWHKNGNTGPHAVLVIHENTCDDI